MWDWIDDITHKVKEDIIALFDNEDLEASISQVFMLRVNSLPHQHKVFMM